MTDQTDRIKQMAQEAGFDIENGEITAPHALIDGDPMDVSEQIARFAQLVAEDCANTSPNGLDIRASAGPAEVWTKFRDAIRARYSLKD